MRRMRGVCCGDNVRRLEFGKRGTMRLREISCAIPGVELDPLSERPYRSTASLAAMFVRPSFGLICAEEAIIKMIEERD